MKRFRIPLAALIAAIFLCLLPGESHALSLDNCAAQTGGSYPQWAYTQKVIACVKGSIKGATLTMTQAISNFMAPIVAAMFTLAVAVFGIRMAGGEPGFTRRAMGLLLRLGLIWMFYYSLGGNLGGIMGGYNMALAPFDIEDELGYIVMSENPWAIADYYLGRILGVGEYTDLTKGLLGIIGVAAVSSTAGGVLFLAGMSALINFLLFIYRVVFTYLTAITVIAFMVVISPFIIPLAVFFHTERYFIKWLDILLSAILVPVLMFAFLHFFIIVFDSLISGLFTTLCGSACASNPAMIDFSAFWKTNEPKFGWLVPNDPHLASQVQGVSGAAGPGTPAVQTNINPFLRRAQDVGMFNTPSVDFGPSNVSIMQKLIWQFLGIWIFASFMKSMVDKIPEIAANIANAASGVSMEPTEFETSVRGSWNQAQAALLGRR